MTESHFPFPEQALSSFLPRSCIHGANSGENSVKFYDFLKKKVDWVWKRSFSKDLSEKTKWEGWGVILNFSSEANQLKIVLKNCYTLNKELNFVQTCHVLSVLREKNFVCLPLLPYFFALVLKKAPFSNLINTFVQFRKFLCIGLCLSVFTSFFPPKIKYTNRQTDTK